MSLETQEENGGRDQELRISGPVASEPDMKLCFVQLLGQRDRSGHRKTRLTRGSVMCRCANGFDKKKGPVTPVDVAGPRVLPL